MHQRKRSDSSRGEALSVPAWTVSGPLTLSGSPLCKRSAPLKYTVSTCQEHTETHKYTTLEVLEAMNVLQRVATQTQRLKAMPARGAEVDRA